MGHELMGWGRGVSAGQVAAMEALAFALQLDGEVASPTPERVAIRDGIDA